MNCKKEINSSGRAEVELYVQSEKKPPRYEQCSCLHVSKKFIFQQTEYTIYSDKVFTVKAQKHQTTKFWRHAVCAWLNSKKDKKLFSIGLFDYEFMFFGHLKNSFSLEYIICFKSSIVPWLSSIAKAFCV